MILNLVKTPDVQNSGGENLITTHTKILIHKSITRKDEIINAVQELLGYLQWHRNYESEGTIPGSEVLVINHV